MAEEIQTYFDKDGAAKKYDDTYDVIVRCKTQKEHDEVVKRLIDSNWYAPEQRMPEEHSKEGFTHKESERLLLTIEEEKGNREIIEGYTVEGKFCEGWPTRRAREPVLAWRILPEPYRGE